MNLSIIIPIYNESENIEKLLSVLNKNLNNLNLKSEIILVDDGSSDNSVFLIKKNIKIYNNLKLISFRRNYGQTAAMMAGFNNSSGEIIIPMDGDLQNDPADIKKIIYKLNEGFDVVSGWRKNRKDSFFSRNLPSYIANFIISYVSGVHLHDYGCSLKGYRKSIMNNVRLYGEMHRFIPIYAAWNGARVTEIPVNHFPRTAGVSKYGISRVYKVLLDLLYIKFFFGYGTKPIHIFGGFGIILLFISLIAAGYAFYIKFIYDISFILTPLPIISAILFSLGIISIFLGFIAEILIRIYFESQKSEIYEISEKVNF